jgi:ankyrin repeat protein
MENERNNKNAPPPAAGSLLEQARPNRRLAFGMGAIVIILLVFAYSFFPRGCGCSSVNTEGIPFYLSSVDAPVLIRAAALGDTQEVRRLVKAGAFLDERDVFGGTALQAAIAFDRPGPALELIMARASLDLTNSDGHTALFIAVLRNNIFITKTLIGAGAEVNGIDALVGYSPLLHAVRNGNTRLVRLLLEHGADSTFRDREGNDAILLAAYWGWTEVFESLLEFGMSLSSTNRQGMNVLALAAEGRRLAMVDRLLRLEAREGLFTVDNAGRGALHWAVLGGHPAVVKRLMDAGIDVSTRAHSGRTALDLARDGQNLMIYEGMIKYIEAQGQALSP